MSAVHPIFEDAMAAMTPVKRLSSLERIEVQRVIENLITLLHPDGYEASEILAALSSAVESRYDNKINCVARIESAHSDLMKAYERAYDSLEGESEHEAKERIADMERA